jgi:hypothetical protein
MVKNIGFLISEKIFECKELPIFETDDFQEIIKFVLIGLKFENDFKRNKKGKLKMMTPKNDYKIYNKYCTSVQKIGEQLKIESLSKLEEFIFGLNSIDNIKFNFRQYVEEKSDEELIRFVSMLTYNKKTKKYEASK